jgi:hypothetical protein
MRTTRSLFAVLAVLALVAPASRPSAQVVVGVSIRVAPPILPVYVQPPIPGPRYIWCPGYWAWGDDDYYWVPGTWVLAPAEGLLWTPGYWGWRDGLYLWNAGYWGPRVGFYGGINYGYGYTGVGFQGGYWSGGVFRYNSSVTNFGSVHITNVYNKTVINNTTVTNVSFNGGTGGATARPTAEEQAAALDKHVSPTAAQTQHQQVASTNRALFASVNKGSPAIAATSKAGHFTGAGVVGVKGAQALPKATNAMRSSGQPGPKQLNMPGAKQLSTASGPIPPKPPGPRPLRPVTGPKSPTLAGQPRHLEQHAKKPVPQHPNKPQNK